MSKRKPRIREKCSHCEHVRGEHGLFLGYCWGIVSGPCQHIGLRGGGCKYKCKEFKKRNRCKSKEQR
jgi:hypothetical protein